MRRGPALVALTLLWASAAPVLAQETPMGRVFAPTDFARFAPRNALEMLRQVAGFVIVEADQTRGLGEAGGNVLVNGQRISGKSTDIATLLGRIPSQDVVRIEIVDGASLNVPGLSGQVANVVARASKASGQFAWQPEFRTQHTQPLLTKGEVSASGRLGPVEYTLGLANQSFRSGAGGATWIYGADRVLTEFRDEEWHGDGERPRFTGRFVYDGPGSSVGNLNLSYRRLFYDYREARLRTVPGQASRPGALDIDEDPHDYEIGGDYDFALGGGRLKLVGLDRFEHAPQIVNQIDRPPGAPATGSRSWRVSDKGEKVARAEYRWRGGSADWQVSGEGAFNSLDYSSGLANLQPDGSLLPVAIAGGVARVKEGRFEAIATYGRALSPTLALQASAGGEYSRLTQVGAGGLSRTFWRPKGSVSLAWKPRTGLGVNLKLDRKVGQLDFFDFVASVDIQANQANAGNPDLVPEQSWGGQVEAVKTLGPYGLTTLRLYGRLIDDIVDFVPIGATGESRGNIDHASQFGVEWKSTLDFTPLGWRGAKLDARFQAQQSRLKDPLTGRPRPISGNLIALTNLTFRYDVPNTPWATGMDANFTLNAKNYRLGEVGRLWEGPLWASMYVEHKDVFDLTVRAQASNLLAADSFWNRTVYTGRRTGPVAFVERRDRSIGPIFSLTVKGRF